MTFGPFVAVEAQAMSALLESAIALWAASDKAGSDRMLMKPALRFTDLPLEIRRQIYGMLTFPLILQYLQ